MLKFHSRNLSIQTAVAYVAEIKPQKTVILKDSKAALQSLISNRSDQPIHQLLKDLQLLPQTVHHFCPLWDSRNERAHHVAKSRSKQLQSLSASTYQEAKTLLHNKDLSGEGPLETTPPPQTQSTIWQDMSRPLYSSCEHDTCSL